jgi:hypothetical protein
MLLAWLLVHDARVEHGAEHTHGSAERERRKATRLLAETNVGATASAETSTIAEPGSKPANPAADPASVNAVNSPGTAVISKSRNNAALRDFSIRKIQPDLVKSPIYVLASGRAKPFTPRTWLRIVVTFNSANTWIDELSFRYRIFIGHETFIGTLTHVDIPGAGEHQVAAFVIPSVVEPLIQSNGFRLDKSVRIEVVALKGENALAQATLGAQPVATQRERPNLLRSVEETPFAPLEMDLYERTAP